MSNEMSLFKSDQPMVVPDYLQGSSLGVGQALMAVIGDTRNRIGLKGSRFRQVLNGQEVGVWDENYLDVIVVGVVPSLSRLFYAGKYKQSGDNAPPVCYSVDNIVPADDVINKQSPKCETCPQNIKGSKTGEDGYEGKACSYFRRMVIMLPGDETLYVVDVKAMGLFGESHEKLNKYSMNDYAKFLQTRGVDASQIVTRLSFDTDQSVPKLLFSPARFVSPEDAAIMRNLKETTQIQDYLTINFKTVDISKEQSAPDEAGEADVAEAAQPQFTQQPVQTPKPSQTVQAQATQTVQQTPKPVVQEAPKQEPKPQTQTQQTPKPVATQQAPKPKPGPGKLVTPAPARSVQGVLVEDNVAMPDEVVQSKPQEVGSVGELEDLIAGLGL